jgi:hypothetical protein
VRETESGQKESLLRVGVAEKTELRFKAPNYEQNFHAGTTFGTTAGMLSVIISSGSAIRY